MSLILAGATSGSTTIQATDAVTATITLPSATSTLISTTSTGQSIPKAALPTGSVLQVVKATFTGTTSTVSTTPVSTPITLSITPNFLTSKILISFSGAVKNGGGGTGFYFLYRNGSSIAQVMENQLTTISNITSAFNYVDSPASTSSITYVVYMNTNNATYATSIGGDSPMNNSIILMEIAA